MEAYLSLFVAIVGLIVYFAFEGKPSTVGLWSFGCGLLAFLIVFGQHTVGALGK